MSNEQPPVEGSQPPVNSTAPGPATPPPVSRPSGAAPVRPEFSAPATSAPDDGPSASQTGPSQAASGGTAQTTPGQGFDAAGSSNAGSFEQEPVSHPGRPPFPETDSEVPRGPAAPLPSAEDLPVPPHPEGPADPGSRFGRPLAAGTGLAAAAINPTKNAAAPNPRPTGRPAPAASRRKPQEQHGPQGLGSAQEESPQATSKGKGRRGRKGKKGSSPGAEKSSSRVSRLSSGVTSMFSGKSSSTTKKGGQSSPTASSTGSKTKVVRYGSLSLVLTTVLVTTGMCGGLFAVTPPDPSILECLGNGSVVTGQTFTGQRFFKREELAAIFYSQAKGLGLSDVAVLAAIATAIQEGSLQSGGLGDPDGEYMSSSRGPFQQKYTWAPEGLAWSGMNWTEETSESHFSIFNPETGEKDAWNPWRGVKWALKDPRMNPAQAANMFFLGGAAAGQPGLEDSKTYQKYANSPSDSVPAEQIGVMAQDVQHARADVVAQYVDKGKPGGEPGNEVHSARTFLKMINEGLIDVPPFEPPIPGIAKQATTPGTKAALKGVVATPGSSAAPSTSSSAAPATTTPTSDVSAVEGDGLLLIGDSVMVGLAKASKHPDMMFSGPVTEFSQGSMRLDQVLGRGGVDVVDVNLGGTEYSTSTQKWRDAIATGPSRILVQLGTNNSNANNEEGIREFMALAGGRQVYWFSMHYKPSEPFNNALTAVAKTDPNLHIVDVSTIVPVLNEPHPSKYYKEMWDSAVEQMSGAIGLIPSQYITGLCEGGNDANNSTFEGGGPYAQAAVEWARYHLTSVTGGWYSYDVNTDPTLGDSDPEKADYNCSTYTSAAWRAATSDAVWLEGLSDSQWADTKNIQLIPASEAQPGDLFFEHNTSKGAAPKISGHVGIIESLEGEGTILHAANDDVGIVRAPLRSRMNSMPDSGYGWLTLKDPSRPNDRSRANTTYTKNFDEAYVGRVIVPANAGEQPSFDA